MTDKNATMLIHIAGACVVAACLVLAFTVLRPYPEASLLMFGLATGLYGKFGFKPADPVLARILQRLGPVEVAMLSSRPPALAPLVVQAVAAGPVRKGELAVMAPSAAEDKTPVTDVVPK